MVCERTRNEGGCHQVPRLPRKVPRRHARPSRPKRATQCHLSHPTLSHTIFHTQLCHTPSSTHNFVTHHLSHTTLSHTIFHIQLCHTPSFTQDFVTHHLSHTTLSYNFVTHHLSHPPLSHTIFHIQLCHTHHLSHITSTVVLRGRRGTHGTGWRAWARLVAHDAAALLRGRRDTW